MSRVALKTYLPAIGASLAMLVIAACEFIPLTRSLNVRPRATEAWPGPPAPQVLWPPSRVFRASYLEGAVSLQAAGTGNRSRVELNRPIVEGDALWSDTASRVELDLGSAAIRMDSRTSLSLLKFNDRVIQAKLAAGAIGVTLRRRSPGEVFEIDTPNVAVTLLNAGQYRLDIDRSMDTTFFTVRTGDAQVSGTHRDFDVHAAQQINVSGPDAVEYGLRSVSAPDKFDDFCDSRDRREERLISGESVSPKYVAPDMIGSADLEEFGTWHVNPVRGAVWTPSIVPADWAPYRFGHWAWIEPWGWTWIDNAPWGFATSHYGRWLFLNGCWSWMPGPRDVQPVYAPALAIFAGGGARGFHYFYWIGSAGVAWFPIGPGEPYAPPYRYSPDDLSRLNAGIDLSRQSHANLSVDGALTAVAREVFVHGQSVEVARVAVAARKASVALVNGTTPPLAPIAESLAPGRHLYVPVPPEAISGTTVVGHRDPAPRPVPFRQRQPLLDAHPGRPLEQSEIETLRKAIDEPERTDVRRARLGVAEREAITPPEPVRTKEEIERLRIADFERLRAIQNELHSMRSPANARP